MKLQSLPTAARSRLATRTQLRLVVDAAELVEP